MSATRRRVNHLQRHVNRRRRYRARVRLSFVEPFIPHVIRARLGHTALRRLPWLVCGGVVFVARAV